MRWIRALVSLALAAAVFWGLDNRHGLFPPLGKLLNPYTGFWRNGARLDAPPAELAVPGLRAEVKVVWDDRQVPHVFAANEHDLALAQGYLTARARLWQMELQTLAAAGRLAEVIGAAAVPLDRTQRRYGMVWAAENAARQMTSDPLTKEIMEAYAAGVNALIMELPPERLPVEYKILDCAPEPWSPLKSALLLKYMAFMLSVENSDLALTRLREVLGEALIDRMFPLTHPMVDPIVPAGTAWDFPAGPATDTPSASLPGSASPGAATAEVRSASGDDKAELGVGSNSWAVAGSRTRSGHPILCNDPHLDLRLPSIWFEIQLNGPGLNAYGVSLPGAPGIIIGHNERIAWGLTNGFSDVTDWYAIKFKDQDRKEYWHDGRWKLTAFRREEIKVRGKAAVVEEVAYTHHGPLVRAEGEAAWSDEVNSVPEGAALRWVAHDPSNELRAIWSLNKARTYGEFTAALATFDCPAQNFTYADVEGRIAVWHNGKFPRRTKGQGRFVLDGSDPAQEWRDWVPRHEVPHVLNPARGFVSSANQAPTDPSYPYYLGWNYEPFERGARINELLTSLGDITPEDMVRMQSDNLNLRARVFVPRLLSLLQGADLAAEERACLRELEAWDFTHRPDFVAPSIFDDVWQEFNTFTWDDEPRGAKVPMKRPASQVTLDLFLYQPDDVVFDDQTTAVRETAADMAIRAVKAACRRLTEQYGPLGPAWSWGETHPLTIGHLGRLPGFGRGPLETSGGGGLVNNISGSLGPSWRQVVALGPEIKAWGIYPGGQSGNPGSPFYGNAVDDWVAGKAYELLFLKSPDEKNPRIVARTTLGGRS
jgi:penicillin amidase